MKGIATCLLFGIYLLSAAQETGVKNIAAVVQLDSVVIVAQKAGFSVEDFIAFVREDESFYRAFKNLRTASYRFDVEMEFQDRKERQKASYRAAQVQYFEASCRWMEILESSSSGNFFKKRKLPKYKYYTAKLYDRLFCTVGKVCNEQSMPDPDGTEDEKRKMEGHVEELKKLIFSPGEKANVPFIENKTAIFSERMSSFYDFMITSDAYNGTECYVFTAAVKPGYADREGKTVIKYLSTWFRKEDFQVMARTYRLNHQTLLYTFDVEMDIRLTKRGTQYFPVQIGYDGFWNIPFKKYEKGTFTVRFSDFGLQKTN